MSVLFVLTLIFTEIIISYNWVTHISMKETVHTVKRKILIIYISLFIKKRLRRNEERKKKFEYYAICVKFGTPK